MTKGKLIKFLGGKLSGKNSSAILYSDRSTGRSPMNLLDIEEHNEIYLEIANGGDSYKGMLTGMLGGMSGLMFLCISAYFLWHGRYQPALEVLLIAISLFIVPFLWEVLRSVPPPILFNRRTREVYFQHDEELFHTPWDGIAAVAYQFQMVGPYTGDMRHASLEILVQCFCHPEKQLMLSLGLPMGKSLELQESSWEYLRAYMNNGPWFDEYGRHSESDAFIKSQLEISGSGTKLFKNTWERIFTEYKRNDGKNFLDFADFYLLIMGILFSPMNTIQEFTYSVAKRRSRKLWPKLVMERLEPNGPTTRLIDIEQKKNLEQQRQSPEKPD